MISKSAVIAFGLATAISTTAYGQTELRNDGFEDGQMVGIQLGFAIGEEGAVTLVPTGTGPFTVQSVRLLFGGATTVETVTLNIYDDSGLTTNPGAPLFSADYQLTGSDSALNEIDLSGDNVVAPGPFQFDPEFQHAGAPSLGRDTDGTNTAGRNWINADGNTWIASGTLGVQGDWIIRATITGGDGPGPDAGPGNDPDGGTTGGACVLNSDCPNGSYCADDDTCSQDCRLDLDCGGGEECNPIGQCVETEGGCGCQSSSGGAPLGVVLIGLIAIGLRRRPRRL